MFPERFSDLPEYAFPRLRTLLDKLEPGGPVLHMTIGEPKHPFPEWVSETVCATAAGFASYPPNDGTPELRGAITGFIARRYGVTLPDDQVMALNGTREGLYNAAMALCPEQKNGKRPVVLIPNPFYQVYMIGAISVGAEPVFVPATKDNGFMPDFAGLPQDILDRAVACYFCTPTNPQGAVATPEYWRDLLALAEKHDFKIFADECYSELYRDAPPVGALDMAQAAGADPERVVLFQSLSKRSNVPGLRSGFVAGGPESLHRIRQLRAYSGAPLPLPIQNASARLWADEAHVIENRALYAEKYVAADRILADVPGYKGPEAGFFLWLPVPDGEAAALKLWQDTGVRVLPGAYLSRDVNGDNPGDGYIRVAMVAPKEEMIAGLTALRDCLYS
ncbi:aminotransferase class I/II-fold pyridoxal phosphate-dependent enzyme [Pseudooceanicola sp. HF7]|uniref:aminotransferase class I/II-fold pyridoxal phosphate-dependent enzyme n=1 Tax=Pseudooceanicola sp. HF7 TaxID=2721560 RepID=UPI0014319BEF|nr:aminotransferase class I/II-fold pyridoxal phosphate-dependent enzyme [Pseudooceanicola sp. HF7]NIZ10562.1 aminotransferase class I/II-fold pyridoxal phosphate-dependent enzyme [Pseudooceanicola sp. HF7]